jgi:hypothetical protein
VADWFKANCTENLLLHLFTGMYAESDDSVDEHATLVHKRKNRRNSVSSSDESSSNSDSDDDSSSNSDSNDDDSEDSDAVDDDHTDHSTNGKLQGNRHVM